ASEHILLGGNQSDAVTVARFPKTRLLGCRWPQDDNVVAGSSGEPSADTALTFHQALAHVLEMEGGFTDDPNDPGGPTNKGVILSVFSRHTGRPLNAFTREERVRELRDISDEVVEDIYRARYWRPSRAEEMPAAIAFMHFDASVNHGLTGASRLLQRALSHNDPGLDVDGEIGPLTMAALQRADEGRLLAHYAEARRSQYRSLRHFWKFGRGWLRRVDRTEARARELIGKATTVTEGRPHAEKGTSMTNTDLKPAPTKWWGNSMTVWGAAITALSTVVPILGPAFGVDVTPDVVRQAGEQFISVVQAVGGLVGTIMAIYGRARATQPLERRNVRVQI
ncbi:MAG: TIGR02594 family protein, partial [Alphaproteobacteria bacterium]|nr:TIGR02594 family protein [Alphaproteobacteria bacterium]